MEGSNDLTGKKGAWGQGGELGKEIPAAGTHPAGWPENLRELEGGSEFCPCGKVSESGTSSCLALWPLSHLSSLLSTGARSIAGFQRCSRYL